MGAGGEGVVEDGVGDGGVGEVADVLPAEGEAGSGGRLGRLEDVGGVLRVGLAGEADAGEALGDGEDDCDRWRRTRCRPRIDRRTGN